MNVKEYTISSTWATGCEGTLVLSGPISDNWAITVGIENASKITFYNFESVIIGNNCLISNRPWASSTLSSGFIAVLIDSQKPLKFTSPTNTGSSSGSSSTNTNSSTNTGSGSSSGSSSTNTNSSTDYTKYVAQKNGKQIIFYHTNWSTYGRNFQVADLPIEYMPTIAYAFYNLREDGSIYSGDSYADTEKVFGGGSNASGSDATNFNGNFGELLKLKKAGKRFNLVLSVGGWTWSKNFSLAVATATTRQTFVDSILNLFNAYPIFNGINLDWEYVSEDGVNYGNGGNMVSVDDGKNLILFIKLLRRAFASTGRSHYKISLAVGSQVKCPVVQLDALLDEWHLMTYDFSSGAWGDKVSTHQSNLYPASHTVCSVSEMVDAYISAGAMPSKMYIGAAFYSRGSSNSGGLGKACSGGSTDKSWEDGICDYKSLPRAGAVEYWDDVAKATYSYDSTKKIFNSYDSVRSITEKCKYVHEKGLKGIIVWETSGDCTKTSPRSLTRALYRNLIVNKQ
jgi:chitinase